MLLNIINYLVQNLIFFTGAYSNNIFPEQLPEEKEVEYIKKAKLATYAAKCSENTTIT